VERGWSLPFWVKIFSPYCFWPVRNAFDECLVLLKMTKLGKFWQKYMNFLPSLIEDETNKLQRRSCNIFTLYLSLGKCTIAWKQKTTFLVQTELGAVKKICSHSNVVCTNKENWRYPKMQLLSPIKVIVCHYTTYNKTTWIWTQDWFIT